MSAATAVSVATWGLTPITEGEESLRRLEQKSGGRLGVCMLDTQSGRHIGHRVGERFGMCSSFKLPLAAVVLNEADRGRLRLDELIPFTKTDLVPHSPIAEKHLSEGSMSVGTMAQAAQQQSDNTVTNLLLKRLGGPLAFTACLRRLGDQVTRLDHYEPDLNRVRQGDVHDTTTPLAMAQFLSPILTRAVLKPASRDKLIDWMVATQTGADRLRAGLPMQWRAGDKTGTWCSQDAANRINDVAIFWPSQRTPIIVSAYFVSPVHADDVRDQDVAVLAEVGRIAASWAVDGAS